MKIFSHYTSNSRYKTGFNWLKKWSLNATLWLGEFMYACKYVYIYLYICVCVYVYTYIHKYIHINIHMYIYIFTVGVELCFTDKE